jgi:hypothetical protein
VVIRVVPPAPHRRESRWSLPPLSAALETGSAVQLAQTVRDIWAEMAMPVAMTSAGVVKIVSEKADRHASQRGRGWHNTLDQHRGRGHRP